MGQKVSMDFILTFFLVSLISFSPAYTNTARAVLLMCGGTDSREDSVVRGRGIDYVWDT